MLRERLERHEFWGVMALAVLHIVILPMAILGGQLLWGWRFGGLSEAGINCVYYAISVAFAFLVAGRFLRRSFDSLLDAPLESVKSFFLSWAIFWGLNIAVTLLLSGFEFFEELSPNQSAIENIAGKNFGATVAMTVFMAPIVEELIFRGGIFGMIYPKSRVAAYVMTILIFSVYHVWQFIFVSGDLRYLLFALEYIPASFALCWCYDKSGSLWTCIAFHMSVNAMSVLML